MRRWIDIVIAVFGLVLLSPILVIFSILVWLQDFCNPFYIAPRVGRGGLNFRMVKLRSMVIGADKVGGSSSGFDDFRITWIGKLIRKLKLDELTQLWNVLKGDMSLVGPRPQVSWAVRAYTEEERKLIDVKPGITDLASIVFADQDSILAGAEDPDLMYSQIIRPWKNRLALLYVKHGDLRSYLEVILLTILALMFRQTALIFVNHVVARLGGNEELLRVARREDIPPAAPPVGADDIVDKIDRS